jgi:hypothetical protein
MLTGISKNLTWRKIDMFQKPFKLIHGWIEDIQPGRENGWCALKLRQQDAAMFNLVAIKPDWPLTPGNEISVAVREDDPERVIAIVDHTAESGILMPHDNQRLRLDREDIAILATVFCTIWMIAGWRGLPVYTITVALYWFATSWLPDTIRQKDMARIAYRLDKDYFHWSMGKDKAKQ